MSNSEFYFRCRRKRFLKGVTICKLFGIANCVRSTCLPPETPRCELKKQTLTWNPTEAKTTCLCQYTQGFNLTTISLWNCERYIQSQLIVARAWHDKNVYNWPCYLLPSKRAILTVVSSYEDLRSGEIESDAVISG